MLGNAHLFEYFGIGNRSSGQRVGAALSVVTAPIFTSGTQRRAQAGSREKMPKQELGNLHDVLGLAGHSPPLHHVRVRVRRVQGR